MSHLPRSWDDDSSVESAGDAEGDALLAVTVPDSTDPDADEHDYDHGHGDIVSLFPVRYLKHKTTYARVLYDVDGFPLLDEQGKSLNIFRHRMKELLEQKVITCMHDIYNRPGYRYFIRDKNQRDRFVRDRDRGYTTRRHTYHIYPDEPGVIMPHETQRELVF